MVMEQRFSPMPSTLAKAAGREDRCTSFSGRRFTILCRLKLLSTSRCFKLFISVYIANVPVGVC